MRTEASKQALTQGPIRRSLIFFALPIFLSNLFQQLYNSADSIIVGQFLGKQALAAVSSSGSLIFMLVGFFNGTAVGAGVVIARLFGAKKYEDMRRAVHTDLAFAIAAGIILTVLGVAFTPVLLKWMRTPDEVLPQSVEYFRVYFYGASAVVLYNICVGILQAVGDSRHPLYYLIFSACLNVVLDLLFIGVFHMGVGSAAAATAISQAVSALLCLVQLVRTKEVYKVSLKEIRFHKDMLGQILRYGLPSGVQNSVIAIANVVVQSNINSFGDDAMAGCGSYSRVEGFAFLPITCFSMSLTTFIGQNLGAQKFDRAKAGARFGILCSVVMAEIIGELFHMEVSRTVINIIILLITCCVYTYSLLHGFKGISILAKVCIYLFFGLLAFVLLFGGETRYIIETGFSSLGKMIQNFIGLSTYTDPMRTTNFPQNWTIYYWAYWMVWCVAAPFFIGSISRGRTVRQTILGGYGFGVGSTLVSFIILGNYSMGKQISGAIDFISQYNENGDLYHLIVSMIKTMPCAPLIMVVVLVTMVAFYATSFDSIALTASCYSYRKLEDGEEPAKGIQLMWCILLILLPIALLFAESSMNSLQSVSIVAAFPIGIVIVMIAVSFLKDAKLYLEELQGGKAHGEEKKENR